MNGVANAVRAADGMDFYTTNDQFRLFYESLPTTDLRTDIAIVELEGRIVGYGRTGWKDEPGGTRIYEIVPFLDTAVADEAYELLVAALEERVRAVAADHPPGARLLETFGGDKAVSREGILKRLGYEPVRHFYSMLRPTLDDLPDAPLPPGLEIRDVTPEHLETIWAADIEAFRDSWGFTEPTDQDREVFMHDPVMSDTTLWRVAWDGDEVAGQVRSYINAEENERFGRLRGYTEHISVRRPWRRRGLARALIVASFELLRARGMTEAALGVDTENESGALRVYEGVGFRPVNRSTTYRKPPD
jgi:ribosomal protein S18 acetylase RimI-like enzyme